MRRLLRRLAWLIMRLFLILVLSFFVLSSTTHSQSLLGTDFSTDRLEATELPILFNSHPADLASRVNALVMRLSRERAESESQELMRLGAASLPILLPRLDALPIEARARVAWDLLPLAKRMTWRGADDVSSPAHAYAYFVEMWRERAVDYQPTVVGRWVERLAARGGGALTQTVVEFDTYALPALIGALPDVKSQTDVERARSLLNVLRRITGLDWAISAQCGINEARTTIDHWQRWWHLHALEFTTVSGPSRWSAMLTQTQFGQWTALALQHRFGTTKEHRPILEHVASAGLKSLALLLGGAAGAFAVALFKRLRSRYSHRSLTSHFSCLVFMSVPQTSIVACLALVGLNHGIAAAVVVACIAIAHLDLESIHPVDNTSALPASTTGRDISEPRHRQALPNWLFAGTSWPFILTLIFVIEQALGLQGLGRCCVDAFRQRDLHLLMALTTVTALWLLLLELVVQSYHPSQHSPIPLETFE